MKRKVLQYIIVMLCTVIGQITQAKVVVYDLRTEQLRNPQGIDVAMPALSWKLRADERAVVA